MEAANYRPSQGYRAALHVWFSHCCSRAASSGMTLSRSGSTSQWKNSESYLSFFFFEGRGHLQKKLRWPALVRAENSSYLFSTRSIGFCTHALGNDGHWM